MARNYTKSFKNHFSGCPRLGLSEICNLGQEIMRICNPLEELVFSVAIISCFSDIYKLHFEPKPLMLFAFIVVTFVIATKVTKKASQKNPSARRAHAGPVF